MKWYYNSQLRTIMRIRSVNLQKEPGNMIILDDDFDAVIGGVGLDEQHVRKDIKFQNIKNPTELELHLTRLIGLHPYLNLPNLANGNVKYLTKIEQEELLEDLNRQLGIQPLKK